jgi:hypothetical protein
MRMAEDTYREKQDTVDRERLGDQLERAAGKLHGVQRRSFVDDPTALCNSCRYANITRQASQNTRVIRCTQNAQQVPEDIVECNSYSSIIALTLGQMAEIAILIDPRKERNHGYL